MGLSSFSELVSAVRDVAGEARRLSLHEPELKGNETAYLTRCIEDGWVSYLGEYVGRFEQGLASATGTAHAIAMVNGTVALHAALLVAGVKPGDEVLVPSLTFVATANAVAHAGAVPHFVDSELGTLGMDPDRLEQYLERVSILEGGICRNRETGRPIKALIPVHIFGHPARMGRLLQVAERFGLLVIEDAAEALGSRQNNRAVGGDGLMATLSFNGNKIVTTGGGGAIVTNDAAVADRVRHLTTTAKKPHVYAFDHDEIGYNYRMPNLNAAVGCAQLEKLESFVERKRRLAAAYAERMAGLPGMRVFREPDGATSNYWLNAILLDEDVADQRDAMLEHFIANGIHCRPVWTPMHRLPMYEACPKADLSTCESIAQRLINLPSSAGLVPS